MTFCGRLYCSTFGCSPWEFLLFAVNTQAWCGELPGRHNFMLNILIIRRPACSVEAQGRLIFQKTFTLQIVVHLLLKTTLGYQKISK